MFAIIRYEGKIFSLDLSTTSIACLSHFTKKGAEILEYRHFR